MTKKSNKDEGYNRGDKYEDRIAKILINKGLLPEGYKRAGATDKADVEINFKGKKIKIEIKAEKKTDPDFGQVTLHWDKEKKWFWSEKKEKEEVVKIYKKIKIIENYINFIPKRFTIDKDKITLADQKSDGQMETREIDIPQETLSKYYEAKNTYYIQIQNLGFFHLAKDIFNIGTVKFPGKINLRLRHKVMNSFEYKNFPKGVDKIKHFDSKKKEWGVRVKKDRDPPHKRYCTGVPTPWDYIFFGVMKKNNKIKAKTSQYDLEELDGREFPFKD